MGGKKLTLADYLRSEPSEMFVSDAQTPVFNHIDFMTLQRMVEVSETALSRSGS